MNLQQLRTKLGKKIYGTDYKVEDGVVTWNGFDWGAGDNPAETSAINYSIVRDLRKAINNQSFDSAIEIGSGYGRVTPWLDLFADKVYAVEPNDEMLSYIRDHYSDVHTINEKAQNIPLENNSVDLVFARSVLHHIPNNDFPQVCNELQRIRTHGGMAVLMEDVKGPESETHHPRPIKEYEDIFNRWNLKENWPRQTPGWEYTIEDQKQVMVFE